MRHTARTRIALLLALAVVGCTPAAPGAHSSGSVKASGDDRYSVYDLGSTWRDQDGRPRLLGSLRGRPRLVAMIYTHCTTTCPLTVSDMKRIARQAPGIGMVLVSLDPARDSSAQLANFAREHGLERERWTLLTASADDVHDLAVTLGIRYRAVTPDELGHSNTLTLLDSSGAIVTRRIDGSDIAQLLDAASRLER